MQEKLEKFVNNTSVGLHAYPPGWPHTNSINNELKQKAGRVTAGPSEHTPLPPILDGIQAKLFSLL